MENLWSMSPAEEVLWMLLIVVCLLSSVLITIGGVGYSVLVFQRRFPFYGVVLIWILQVVAIIGCICGEWQSALLQYCFFSPIPALVLGGAIIHENRKQRRATHANQHVS